MATRLAGPGVWSRGWRGQMPWRWGNDACPPCQQHEGLEGQGLAQRGCCSPSRGIKKERAAAQGPRRAKVGAGLGVPAGVPRGQLGAAVVPGGLRRSLVLQHGRGSRERRGLCSCTRRLVKANESGLVAEARRLCGGE